MTAIQEVIQVTKGGIGALSNALRMYGNELDQTIPWTTYRDTCRELDRYRDDYSYESGQLVGEIKGLLNNAQDSYHSAMQNIYEWSSVAKELLIKYRQLFDERSSNAYGQQKAILIQVLGIGSTKMGSAQEKLQQSSVNFNNVAGKLTTLHSRFTNEFDSKSSYYQGQVDKIRKEAYISASVAGPFGLIIAAGIVEGKLIPELNDKLNRTKNYFDHLKSLIEQSDRDIDSTKGKLRNEVQNIGDMKVKTEATKTLISIDDLDALRDNVLASVNDLIDQCGTYMMRHTSSF